MYADTPKTIRSRCAMLTSAKSTPEIRRYCWFDISLLRRQDGAIKADAVFTAINRNELGISLRRAARARNTGRACRYWMNPLCSLFATSDIATDSDEAVQVVEHASRVPSGPRIFIRLPARLWILPPVPPLSDHGPGSAHVLAGLSQRRQWTTHPSL